MLAVWINKGNFEYDVHSIIKAFYPEETVKVLMPETGEQKRQEFGADVRLEIWLTDDGARLIDRGLNRLPVKASRQEDVGQETDSFYWQWDAESDHSYKDGFKRFLYQSLSRITGCTLPWGNLTGIRPTKIAYGMLEEGKTDKEILDYLKDKHFVSSKKSKLSIDIAKRERDLLTDIHYEGGYSLYIGIPFCPTTCLYCSFTSFAIGAYRKQVEDYIDCLIKEMDYVARRYAHKILDSVYIGGGTPTTLEAEQLDRLIGALKGGLTASSAGIMAAMVSALLAALFFKSKPKR